MTPKLYKSDWPAVASTSPQLPPQRKVRVEAGALVDAPLAGVVLAVVAEVEAGSKQSQAELSQLTSIFWTAHIDSVYNDAVKHADSRLHCAV